PWRLAEQEGAPRTPDVAAPARDSGRRRDYGPRGPGAPPASLGARLPERGRRGRAHPYAPGRRGRGHRRDPRPTRRRLGGLPARELEPRRRARPPLYATARHARLGHDPATRRLQGG